jgi:drug/metabolite transporter (DMT)-like permease
MSTQPSPAGPVPDSLRGIALMSLTVLLFAVLDTLTKYLTRFYPVNVILWCRYLIQVVLMVLVFAPSMGQRLFRSTRPLQQLARAALLLGASFCMTAGLRHLPIAEATSIIFLAPLLVCLLSVPLLGEKVEAPDWIAVALGFIGIVIILRPGGAVLSWAALLPLATALFNSLYQIVTRRFKNQEHPLTTNFFIGVLAVCVLSVPLPASWVTPTLPHAAILLAMGVAGLGGHVLWIKALSHSPPSTLGPFSYAQLLWATLFGYLIFGVLPDTGSVIGMAVIAAGGLYLTIRHIRLPRGA